MENKRVIIFGTGPLAINLFKYMQNDARYDVAAFCVDLAYKTLDELFGLPVIALEQIEDLFPPSLHDMIIAIGYSKMRARKLLFDKLQAIGYGFINYTHPSIVNHAKNIGSGNIILPGCTIENGVTIGDNNVIWSMTLLGHDASIGHHNYISAKCLISGDSNIADLCFIGNGVIMINGINIANETCVGAATYLKKSTQANGLYAGNPAKLLKFNPNGIEIK